MDRTADFFGTIAAGVPDRKVYQQVPPSKQGPLASHGFQEDVQNIQNSFVELEKLLVQLSSLAKYKTLFDDKTREIELVTSRIKNMLQGITNNIDTLEKTHMNDGVARDSSSHRSTVITTLRNRTMDATKRFTTALQTRRKTLESIEARRGLFGATGTYDIEAQEDILDVDRAPQQQSAIMQAYHQSRSEAVEQVQRMIGEVSTMFQRIASLVGQQEEMVLRIDATMDDSLTRLREGQFQLLKYFTHIKGQRQLIFKLLAMLTAFAMFFIIFLA